MQSGGSQSALLAQWIRHWIVPAARYLVLAGAAALMALPLVLMVSAALKTPDELARNPYALVPESWRWDNFPAALSALPYWRHLANTLVLCVGTVIGTTCSCTLAAYALARLQWRGRSLVFLLVLGSMLLPWQVTMVPRFVLIAQLGLYDSLWAIILPTFLGDAYSIFLLRQFFLSLPEELLEAARLDGLGPWGVLWHVVLPLSRPAIATVALLQFVETWNDFSGPLLYLNDPDKFPLAYGLERFVSAFGDQTHLLMAAAILFSLPLVIVFFLTQRTFIQGMTTTGIKG